MPFAVRWTLAHDAVARSVQQQDGETIAETSLRFLPPNCCFYYIVHTFLCQIGVQRFSVQLSAVSRQLLALSGQAPPNWM